MTRSERLGRVMLQAGWNALWDDSAERLVDSASAARASRLALLVFLAVNAHLLLIGVLVDSSQTLPISPQTLSAAGFYSAAAFDSTVFAVGLQLALPR